MATKEGEKVDNYLERTLSVVNKMKSNGEIMAQSTMVNKILRSLTSKFNYVVCSIEESNDLSTLSIDEVHSSLLVHEQWMQEFQMDKHVLKVNNDDQFGRNNNDRFGRCKGGRNRGRGRGIYLINKALIECFKCHKLVHFQL